MQGGRLTMTARAPHPAQPLLRADGKELSAPHPFIYTGWSLLCPSWLVGKIHGPQDILVTRLPIYLNSIEPDEIGGILALYFKQYEPQFGWRDIVLTPSYAYRKAKCFSRGVVIYHMPSFRKFINVSVDELRLAQGSER